ncbi:MAG: M1 family metallopeptidase [Deltaproteobacteria bacterium]|nr:M1 family metallopeptidase [Deltaproteobacteria bacterium]MBW2343469.1 M1 family metallopeptidase [Deltaproteobacteria bacterium]
MTDINPINYKIHLEPDLENFSFSGSTEILVNASKPVNDITLNILELDIRNCKVQVGDEFPDCNFHAHPEKERMTISLPNEMAGEIKLKIDYAGQINDRMAGFYRSKYSAKGKEKYIAVTQFEESDARRAFPCFDRPDKKATFDIEMVIDEDLTAISNSHVTLEQASGAGKKLVRFAQTAKMSTYLLFFGVGEFEFIEDPGHVLVRAVAMPGMIKHAGFGLEFGRKSLDFCEENFGTEYPLEKLDLIAVPDFAFGAMENWGAITFRENLLLHFPGITSKAGEERICEVIAHEIVHQWFGNLVTPSDWKYLWLNESFATYFGYGAVAHYHPEWDIWEQFLHSQTHTALERDSLLETFPIEIPGGEHVVINTATAPIIYNKGASILRHIKGYMGEEAFKEGLRYYLKKHEYACASGPDMWEAFEEVSEIPITRIMKSWIEQPGFPIVEAKKDGNTLVLKQKRFSYLPNNSDQTWLVPISVRVFYENGDSKIISALLENKQINMDIGDNAVAYKVNDRQTGFYRVRYEDGSDLHELGKLVSGKELPAEDRWGLQNDLYALVKGGHAGMDDYIAFVSNYSHEDAFLPLISIAENLFHAYLIMEGHEKEKVAATGRSLLDKVLGDMGYEPDPVEKHTTSVLRDQILFHAVLYGSKDAEKFALDKFSSLMEGDAVHPDVMKSVMQAGALRGDHKVFDWFDKRVHSSQSEHERMNILVALANFSDRTLIEKAQQYILDKVPNRNKFIPAGAMTINPHAIPYMWDWYRSQVKALEDLHPLHYERIIAGIIPVCGLGREDEIKGFFENYVTEKGLSKDVLRLSLEKLEINGRMRGYNTDLENFS